MKAIVHTSYGPPEVAKLTEIEKPIPAKDQVLIKVYASSVNRTDAGFRSAVYFVSRFWSGLFKPKCQTLGSEFSGVIVEVGAEVSHFRIGDRVFGYNDTSFGGHAEFLASDENSISILPETISFEEGATLTEGAHYALNNIRVSKIQKGQNALVYGATGAIGSAALQILKHEGVYVTAVCNSKNVELMKALGADNVVDYQTEDFTRLDQKFEFIFDAVGKSSYNQCKPLLKQKGIYVSTELGKGGQNIWLALITPIFGGKKVIFPIPKMNKEVLEYLKKLAEEGKFKPIIDRIYSLEQIVEAYTYVEKGQKTGNVVIKII